MKTYIGTKISKGMPMTLGEYNIYQGWTLPEDQDANKPGYLIEYLDGGEPNHKDHAGYISWSPAAQFENAYVDIELGVGLGHAVEMMEQGYKVSRMGWNGKGMWVIYNPGSQGETHAMFEGSVYKQHGVDECEILPHFDMYTVNAEGRRAMLPGWLASQTDLAAKDWYACGVARAGTTTDVEPDDGITDHD